MAVIVVNYAAHELIEHNLNSAQLPSEEFRVVLVDNFSGNEETRAIRQVAKAHRWHLVERSTNAGFGAGVNAGIEEAIRLGSECFLLLNPDARLSASVAVALHEECSRTPLALVAPTIVASDGAVYFDGAVVDMTKTKIRSVTAARNFTMSPQGCSAEIDGRRGPVVPWLTGACVAFGVEIYRRTAGMDESFFLYWEDVDFSYRARRAGATLIIRHDLRVVHDEGGTQGERRGRAKSTAYYYFNCRNRLLFAVKHVSRRHLLRWMIRTPAVSWAILLQGGRRQIVHSPGVVLAALRGSAIGVVLAVRAVAGRAVVPTPPGGDAVADRPRVGVGRR